MFFLHHHFGLSIANEGDKYLSRAEQLANGDFRIATQYQTFYTAYVIYLSLYKILNLPTLFVFMGNYLLSLLAYWKFYKLLKSLYDAKTAKIWLLLMGLSPLIQYWQMNLFSETFFIALSLLFIYVTLFPAITQRIFKSAALGLIVIFARPSGLFTVICVVFVALYQSGFISKKTAKLSGSITLLLLFLFVVFIFKLPYHDFAQYISNGSIYYGFPGWSQELPPGDYTLFHCYDFLYQTKGLKTILILFIRKLDSFFVLSRPYYSNMHNWLNQIHYVFYILGATGALLITKTKTQSGFLKILCLVIILNAGMIALIFNEWSERHTLQIFPYIFALSAFALSRTIELFSSSK